MLTTASFSVGCNLMAVSTKKRAAPAAMVGLRLVAEPQHTSLVLAAFHQVKVSRSQQNGCRFRNRRQNSLWGVLLPYSLDGKRVWRFPH